MNPYSEAIGMFLYHLLQIVRAEWFPYAVSVWIGVAVLSDALQGRRFMKKLEKLVSAEWIFSQCEVAEDKEKGVNSYTSESPRILFYPRRFLGQTACALRDFFTWPLKSAVVPTVQLISGKLYPFGEEGYSVQNAFIATFFGVFLTLFAYGDSIAIANGLDALGLIRGSIPVFLLYYEFAVGVATFLAIVVGFFEFFRSYGLEDAAKGEGDRRKIRVRRSLSLLIIVIGIAAAAFLGLGRIMALGYWENSAGLRLVVQFGINVLTLVNGIMAAALVFEEGIDGYRILLSLLGYGIAGVLLLVDAVLYMGIRSIVVVVDILWRALNVIVGIPLFLVFEPLIAIFRLLIGIGRIIGNMFK